MARKITVLLTAAQIDALVGASCTEELHLEDRQLDGDPDAGRRMATLDRATTALLKAKREQAQ